MSWASVYWDLDHIVRAAREAMEAAYASDQSVPAVSLNPAPEISVVENLGPQDRAASGADPGIAEITISITADPAPAAGSGPPPEIELEVSLVKSSLTAKPITEETASVQLRTLWTPEIEAALREFLRPLSVNLRYEYRVRDAFDEQRSIATLNSLFRQRPKTDEIDIRDVSDRNEFHRKRMNELRKPGATSKRLSFGR